MLKIQVIIASIRVGRRAENVAKWVNKELDTHKNIQTEILDLRKWSLPYYDEPIPRIAKKWIKKVNEADGYIIITPEYNHGYPAQLKTALDYPYREWNQKPIGFVSYSTGYFGGNKVVEQLKQVALELQMYPIREAVYVQRVHEIFADKSKEVLDLDLNDKLKVFIKQLLWWSKILKTARLKIKQ